MDDTLGCAALQTEISLRPKELQMYTLDISNQQGRKENQSFTVRATTHSHLSIRAKSIRIYARMWRTICFGAACAYLDFSLWQ